MQIQTGMQLQIPPPPPPGGSAGSAEKVSFETGSQPIKTEEFAEELIVISERDAQPCRPSDVMIKTQLDVESQALIVNCVPLGNVKLTLYLPSGPPCTFIFPELEFA